MHAWLTKAEVHVADLKYSMLHPTLMCLTVLVAVIILVLPAPIYAQNDLTSSSLTSTAQREPATVSIPRTDGPRNVLASFLKLRNEYELLLSSYLETPTRAELNRIIDVTDSVRALIDLESVPSADKAFLGNATVRALFDIFGRIDLPPLTEVPDEAAFDTKDRAAYRIPATPIGIVRVEAGPRAGEYLFEQRTTVSAPRFLRAIEKQPLRSSLGIQSWSSYLPQIAGPAISADTIASIPAGLKRLVLGTPIWKIILTVFAIGSIAIFLALLHRWTLARQTGNQLEALAWRLVTPSALLLALHVLLPQATLQIIPNYHFAGLLSQTNILLTYVALAWVFWIVTRFTVEWFALAPQIAEQSSEANLLRLLGGLFGVVGVVIIVSIGGQALGLPIMSIVAGLGIGGIAVALAIRPTLENLIGGIILSIDRPVRVGDYCTFGANAGTIENVGIRSTTIRAADRTLISVPNARFVDMELVNWAQCDTMLISAVIGLRFETTPDQIRYLLAEIRKMLHAHPRIDQETIRVRYSGPGASSRDVSIRIHALTREWNEFYAIREDVFLRIDDLVAGAGTDYAFPSQTLYLGRDGGIDDTLREAAEAQVATWRRLNRLPFPKLAKDEISRLRGTLDYPPLGSFDRKNEAGIEDVAPEPLSTETLTSVGTGHRGGSTESAVTKKRNP